MPERFELISQIGKGGMGVVWKARDLETGEIIALKLLHELYVDDEDYVARLEREVEYRAAHRLAVCGEGAWVRPPGRRAVRRDGVHRGAVA